jgi:hypothetical protein
MGMGMGRLEERGEVLWMVFASTWIVLLFYSRRRLLARFRGGVALGLDGLFRFKS